MQAKEYLEVSDISKLKGKKKIPESYMFDNGILILKVSLNSMPGQPRTEHFRI